MGISISSVVDAPVDDVFAWFERPGAFRRLMPPWQPLRVRREAESLRDGRAVVWSPPGLTVTAQHRPDGYWPPRQFVDEIVSYPISKVLRWRHVHEFTPVDDGTTRVTDRIDTTIPEAFLKAGIRYRHRQLADDLAAHARAAAYRQEPMTVAISGSSGFVGSALAAFLSTGGHRVVRLVRSAPRRRDERLWRPDDPAPDLLEGVDAVVHLAGASIFGRFTERHRRAVRETRIGPTRRLAECAARDGGPQVFVSASAVGFYGPDRGDEILTEDSERGDGFLADVVADWEAATQPAADAGRRVVNIRTGIVQSPLGGLLQLLYPVFFAGAGGKIGDGQQWLSWIGLDDLTDVYLRALVDDDLSGPVNAVAPDPVRNAEYTRTLASVLRRPSFVPVPSAVPKAVLGEQGAEEFAEASQRVQPARLVDAGHVFRYADLDAALRHMLGR